MPIFPAAYHQLHRSLRPHLPLNVDFYRLLLLHLSILLFWLLLFLPSGFDFDCELTELLNEPSFLESIVKFCIALFNALM